MVMSEHAIFWSHRRITQYRIREFLIINGRNVTVDKPVGWFNKDYLPTRNTN